MDLLEISVRTDGEAAEAISELFNRLGQGGAVIEEAPSQASRAVLVRTYLHDDEHLADKRREIEEGLWHLSLLYPFPPAEFRILQEDDWANAWKAFHPVQHVGGRIVLKPTWREHTPQPGELIIELDPGMAFGTGQHPSTRLCLLAIERYLRPGMRMIDVGTGSGILTILAARLGAAEMFACDIDGLSVKVARENCALNGVSAHLRLETGSLGDLDFGPEPWDMLLMNILAPVIIELLPLARPRLRDGGLIVLAGLIEPQVDGVKEQMDAVGITEIDRMQDGDWVMLVGRTGGGEQ
ncbi:MAG: 50S ribosomal protein L11 methyltransferase [Chloroflexi bacterium]|nr:50S ribosomal protein L11 methyltransferase [Chloroflexota bacterium]